MAAWASTPRGLGGPRNRGRLIHPEKFLERVPAWLRKLLPQTPSERLSRAIALRGQTLLALFLLGDAYDWADTEVQKLLLQLGLLKPSEAGEAPAGPIHLDAVRQTAAESPRPAAARHHG